VDGGFFSSAGQGLQAEAAAQKKKAVAIATAF